MAQFLVKSLNELSVITTSNDSISIGRHPDNAIILQDDTVSRQHALILCRSEQFYIHDTDSTYGTFVNGVLIDGERELADGDIVAVGGAALLFRIDSIEPHDRERLLEYKKPTGTESEINEDDEESLNEDLIAYKIPSHEYRTAERLTGWRYECLTRIALTMQTATNLDDLLNTILSTIFEIFRPARGAILICQDTDGKFETRVKQPDDDSFFVSRTIVDYVTSNQMSVLVTEMAVDERFLGAASVMEQSISAAICCPLISRDRVLGVLYLDTQTDSLSYTSADIALLSIIAANAAMSIENANLLRRSREVRGQGIADTEPLIAHSPDMRIVEERIQDLARDRKPVLIRGEPGTGKYFIAKLIHQGGSAADKPFITLDCARVFDRSPSQILFGAVESKGEQGTPVPGEIQTMAPDGLIQEAQNGTLVLKNIEALEVPAQRALRDFLARQNVHKDDKPTPRLIFTTSEDLGKLVKADRFDRSLAGTLDDHLLEVPRLQNRREDILPLARYFLSSSDQLSDGRPHNFTLSAEQALLKLKYRDSNVTELRQAIELAAILADGPTISAEHLFTGPTDWSHRIELGLDTNTVFKWLSKAWLTNLLQLSMLGVFFGLTIICLVAGNSTVGRTANTMLWGLWWPTLLALFLFIGRVWCYLCPISKAGSLLQKVGSLDLRPARWIKNHTNWIIAFCFFLIVWCEHVFHMTDHPQATGIFLITLLFSGTMLGFIFRRETFCRYMCPLGNLSACYSIPSLLQVHSNSVICSSRCRTHECYRGSDTESGCPSFHHPLYVRDAHFCKLCLQCLRSCPHGSARLYLRPPLRDIWATRELSSTLEVTCLVVFLLTIVMLASRAEIGSTNDTLVYTVMSTSCLGLAYLLSRLLTRIFGSEGDQITATRAAFILALLAWGPLMAFHIGNIPGIGTLTIGTGTEAISAGVSPAWGLSLLKVLQFAVILFSVFLAGLALWRTWVRTRLRMGKAYRSGWLILVAIMVAYSFVVFYLVA